MPDSNNVYHGDEANVLPSNTAAFLHLTDQFQRIEQERRMQQRYEQRQEDARQQNIRQGIHDDIYNPAYLKNDPTNPLIRKQMDDISGQALQAMKQPGGDERAMDIINKGTADLSQASQRIAQANQNAMKQIALYQHQHPEWDGANAANLAATNLWFKKDKNGNVVNKSLDEINPDEDYLSGVINGEHGNDLWSDGAVKKSWDTHFKNEPTVDAIEHTSYNHDGSLHVLGYKGKVAPRYVDVVDDGQGGKTTALKSTNYTLPGEKSAYIDPTTKQPVKVLPDELYNQLSQNDGIRAGVEKKVRQELDKTANFNKSGESNFSPDSEYANMLRKKFMYDAAQGELQDRFKINNDKDESFNKGLQARAANRADINTGLSRERLGIAYQTLQMRKDKIADGENPDDALSKNFLNDVAEKYGKKLTVETVPAQKPWFGKDTPAEYGEKIIIPITADERDLNIVAGKADKTGKRPVKAKTFTTADGEKIKGYEYDPATGNAIGDFGKTIDNESVQREYLKDVKPAVRKEVDKTSVISKVINKVVGKKKELSLAEQMKAAKQ